MNWEAMKKNVGYRVQLQPIAQHLDHRGVELQTIDDDWVIQSVGGETVEISNLRTGHRTNLGKDHIHNFTSNPDRCTEGLKYGFLTLRVQISMQGPALRIRPTLRPGEPLAAETAQSRHSYQNELAAMIGQTRNALEQLVASRASDQARAEVAHLEEEVSSWLESRLGKLYAEGFRSAPPSVQVPTNYPAKFGGIYQRLRGKLSYLSSVAAKLTD
jgi:hypothetical protein